MWNARRDPVSPTNSIGGAGLVGSIPADPTRHVLQDSHVNYRPPHFSCRTPPKGVDRTPLKGISCTPLTVGAYPRPLHRRTIQKRALCLVKPQRGAAAPRLFGTSSLHR